MKQNNLSVIGSTEKITFPEYELADIPAKVDTGADSSSIWASDVQVTPEGLRYVLFGSGSRYHTGKVLTDPNYRIVSVRNSFGASEFRYKVRLTVRLAGRTIKAWFTLSDRAGMRYPVLIGRRSLKDKFVVDVSRRQASPIARRVPRILILDASGEMQPFANEVAARMKHPVEIVNRSYDTLLFRVETGNTQVIETTTGTDLAEFDLVYFKSHHRNYEFAIAAAAYLAYHNVAFIDRELRERVSYDKLSESMTFALHGLPVPPLFSGSSAVLSKQFSTITKTLGTPFVCKDINEARGRRNYVLSSEAEFETVIQASKGTFMLQRFIENDGYIRGYVFGKNVGPVIWRDAINKHVDPRKRHLNNPVGGANARPLPTGQLPPAVHTLAIQASMLMNRQVAGVDIIQDTKTKEWFVLEVNTAPQIRTGSLPAEKRAALAGLLDFELNR